MLEISTVLNSRQEFHALDKDGNQRIPHSFTCRRVLQDIPRLQPIGVPCLDTYAECHLMTLQDCIYARFSLFDRNPDIGLYIIKTLQRHDNHRWKQIVLWNLHDLAPIMSLCSGADPTYDARLSRRRRLNAPQRREDNSQCSGSREWERQNGILLSMALVVILIGKNNGVRATIQS